MLAMSPTGHGNSSLPKRAFVKDAARPAIRGTQIWCYTVVCARRGADFGEFYTYSRIYCGCRRPIVAFSVPTATIGPWIGVKLAKIYCCLLSYARFYTFLVAMGTWSCIRVHGSGVLVCGGRGELFPIFPPPPHPPPSPRSVMVGPYVSGPYLDIVNCQSWFFSLSSEIR